MTQATAERSESAVDQKLEQELEVVFSPLHKRCLGIAVGSVAALLVAGLTFVHIARSPEVDEPLVLLAQYFKGYSVTPVGALIGALWAFWVGFVVGWFFAFCRNLALVATAVFFRARAELAENKGFLDHI